MQNTASSAANQIRQLAIHVDTQLDEIKALIVCPQTTAQENIQGVNSNINELYNSEREWNTAFE